MAPTNDAPNSPWWRSPAAGLGLVNAVCWVLPLAWKQGPYGGRFALWNVYVGVPAALAWLIALTLPRMPARLRRPVGFRLAAALGAGVVGLAALDVAYTAWSARFGEIWYFYQHFSKRHHEADPELVWKNRPGVVWRGRKTPSCDPVLYRTDEHGFRNPPGVGKVEIVFVGDSVTEAGEVNEEATFVRKAGEALGAGVLNLGVSGYGPQQELAVLRRYGLPRRPALAVWQVTEWNDVPDALNYAERHRQSELARLSLLDLYRPHSPLARLVAAALPPRSPSRVKVRRTDGVVEEQSIWPYVPDYHVRHPRGFAETVRAIREARDLCRAQGAEFVVLYVPSHVRVLWPALEFKSPAQREKYCPGGTPDRDDDLAHAVADACAALGCPLLDVLPDLRRRASADNRRVYVRNDPHLGVDGHDEVARALTAWVRSRGLDVARAVDDRGATF